MVNDRHSSQMPTAALHQSAVLKQAGTRVWGSAAQSGFYEEPVMFLPHVPSFSWKRRFLEKVSLITLNSQSTIQTTKSESQQM